MQSEATLPDARRAYSLVHGDALSVLRTLPDACVSVTITSPPYYKQKDYGCANQIGWEASVTGFLGRLSDTLFELRRVTHPRGSCFIVIGDSYANKSLVLVPQRLAIAAADIGWTVRNDLIWSKLDAPPDNVADRWRFTHEHVLFLTREPRGYSFDVDAIRIPYAEKTLARWGNGQAYGGTKAKAIAGPAGQRFKRGRTFRLNSKGTIPRDVISMGTARSPLDHFATYPIELIEPFVAATSRPGELILDPFSGSGTTGVAAIRAGRRYLGVDVNESYLRLSAARLSDALSCARPVTTPKSVRIVNRRGSTK